MAQFDLSPCPAHTQDRPLVSRATRKKPVERQTNISYMQGRPPRGTRQYNSGTDRYDLKLLCCRVRYSSLNGARNGVEQWELALSGLATLAFFDMNGQEEYWRALLKWKRRGKTARKYVNDKKKSIGRKDVGTR